MENRRRVTEEDLLLTEAVIAESYGKLKQLVVQVPSRALGSLSGTVRKHPYAAAATAIVGGIAVYGIFRLITSGNSGQATQGRSRVTMQNDTSRPDLMHEILPMIMPMVTPYITGYIQKNLGRILFGGRD